MKKKSMIWILPTAVGPFVGVLVALIIIAVLLVPTVLGEHEEPVEPTTSETVETESETHETDGVSETDESTTEESSEAETNQTEPIFGG